MGFGGVYNKDIDLHPTTWRWVGVLKRKNVFCSGRRNDTGVKRSTMSIRIREWNKLQSLFWDLSTYIDNRVFAKLILK